MRAPIVVAALMMFVLAGCSEGRAGAPQASITREFPVGAFSAIDLETSMDVTVRTGSAPSATATGQQDMVDALDLAVRGDTLVVRTIDRRGRGWNGPAPTIVVTVPDLAAARVKSSGSIAVDRVRGDDFRGSVESSGSLDLGEVDVRTLALAVSSSGSISARGRTERATYGTSSSGSLDLDGVTAREAAIDVSSSGSVDATVTSAVRFALSGSGSIAVSGGARCDGQRSGSGSIDCS